VAALMTGCGTPQPKQSASLTPPTSPTLPAQPTKSSGVLTEQPLDAVFTMVTPNQVYRNARFNTADLATSGGLQLCVECDIAEFLQVDNLTVHTVLLNQAGAGSGTDQAGNPVTWSGFLDCESLTSSSTILPSTEWRIEFPEATCDVQMVFSPQDVFHKSSLWSVVALFSFDSTSGRFNFEHAEFQEK
jgi:hypothetical protein